MNSEAPEIKKNCMEQTFYILVFDIWMEEPSQLAISEQVTCLGFCLILLSRRISEYENCFVFILIHAKEATSMYFISIWEVFDLK